MDIFRQEYTGVTPEVSAYVLSIKQKAQELWDLIDTPVNKDGEDNRTDARCMATAKTQLEQAVMWAIKGLTA